MTNTYKLAKIWQYLLIIPSVCLILLFWSLFIFEDDLRGIPAGAWILLITVTTISSSFIYYALTSKTITSPEGIENLSFGVRVKVAWDKVERIDMNPQGFVNLVFKESIYKNKLVNTVLSPLAYDRTFQLSPYIENLATSNLLKDIVRHTPNSNIPEFASQQNRSTATYQKVGTIGLYYFGCFIVLVLFGIIFQKGFDENLVTLGVIHANFFSSFIVLSMIVGLLVNTVRLFGYNAEISKLQENEISRKARAYYLCPIIIMLISSIVSIVFWFFLKTPSDFEVFIMVVIGAVSLPISSRIERLLFQDNMQ